MLITALRQEPIITCQNNKRWRTAPCDVLSKNAWYVLGEKYAQLSQLILIRHFPLFYYGSKHSWIHCAAAQLFLQRAHVANKVTATHSRGSLSGWHSAETSQEVINQTVDSVCLLTSVHCQRWLEVTWQQILPSVAPKYMSCLMTDKTSTNEVCVSIYTRCMYYYKSHDSPFKDIFVFYNHKHKGSSTGQSYGNTDTLLTFSFLSYIPNIGICTLKKQRNILRDNLSSITVLKVEVLQNHRSCFWSHIETT